MNRRRVVITGLGTISSLGFSAEELYRNLRAGKSAVHAMPDWPDALDGSFRIAAPVELPQEMARSIDRQHRRSMGNIAIYSALAARNAVQDSGLSDEVIKGGRCACVIGSTMGGSNSISEAFRIMLLDHSQDISAMHFFKSVSNTAAFNTANFLGITGVVEAPSAACASGLQAVGIARDLIAYGQQDFAVCGGAEELSPEVSASFELIFAAVPGEQLPPEKASRPFDLARRGLVCGEGAGILVLEEYEHARVRGARIYGEIIGYATCCSGSQLSQSSANAIEHCLSLVYDDAQINPEKTDYISAHATSTGQGDAEEAKALAHFFGDHIPVSSLKGNLGHTLGASGTIELAASLLMMRDSIILPTRNLEKIDPACAGICHVREPIEKKISVFMKNCFAFGGINATLLCKKIE